MSRTRAGVVAATGLLAALLLVAVPATAQTSSDPSTTDTSSTTQPLITIPSVSQPPPSSSPPTSDPNQNGDAPPASIQPSPQTVPPTTAPPGSPIRPSTGRVVQTNLASAKAQALARQAAYDDAVALRMQLEAQLASLQAQVGTLAQQSAQAVRDLTAAHDALVARAADAYMRGPVVIDDSLRTAADDTAAGQKSVLIGAVVDADRAAVDRYADARKKVTDAQAKLADDISVTQAQLTQAQVDEQQAQANLQDARLDLAVTTAGGSLVIHGFVFPVAQPHTFHDDFGDPRNPGTPQAHTHQGNDIQAAEGTEEYACERGVITQLDSGGLGGTGLFLKGESGTYYYYAHLSAYAPNISQGTVVDAGQLIGYVGHTGDATGPHLHFEVHPNGGAAIDPYPLLVAADQPGAAAAA